MPPAPITVKLRCASWRQLASIHRRDLSRSAFFLKSSKPPPVGTRMRINLTLPSETLIILTGTIAEHVPMGGMGGRGPGVDIKLNAIPQSAMWLIETAIHAAERGQDPTPGLGGPGVSPGRPAEAAEPEKPAPAVEDGIDLVEAEDELVEALQQELESIGKLNPFQVLGVGYGADDRSVRSAFGELTKRYHPDRFARYESAEARELAAEIFIVIRDAYRRLGDAPSRARVLRSLRRGKAKSEHLAHAPTVHAGAPKPPATPPTRRIGPNEAPPKPSPRAPTHDELFSEEPRAASEGEGPVSVEQEQSAPKSSGRFEHANRLLDRGEYDAAVRIYTIACKRDPEDRAARVGLELAEGLKALAQRDRLEAAQRFEEVLELDPSNERAARELAEMRRQATNERKGLLSRLLDKHE